MVRAEADSTHEFDNIVVREYLEATGRYGYDALGRRVARTSDGERYDDLRYVYDGWQVAEERDAAGTVRAEYVYGNGLDEVLRMARGGQAYYYHHNDQGTVHAVTDAAGAVAERYAYGAFGEPLVYDGTGQALTASVVGNPYLFAGREWDGETRFYNFRHRYLDPRQGRFLTRDPLGSWADPGNWGNPYAYCANAPWTFTDPLGLAGGPDPLGNLPDWRVQFTGGATPRAGVWAIQAHANEPFAHHVRDWVEAGAAFPASPDRKDLVGGIWWSPFEINGV